jgi:2-oxo-3-hexenedioate decarboxylase
VSDLARLLDAAAREGRLLEGLPEPLTVEQAYAVQGELLALREARGERLVGWKMGLTSRAKMVQMGIEEPIRGFLTDAMVLEDNAVLDLSRLRQPRVEPEICFVMEREIAGPVTAAQALAAVRGVCPALEVIDSRYKDFKFNLPNVVADDTSAAFVVLGSTLSPPDGLDSLGVVLELDDKVVETASSAAIYDHPARSLAALLNMMAPRPLRPGDIVMSGGATAAHPLAGHARVRVCVERLGSASLRLRGGLSQ